MGKVEVLYEDNHIFVVNKPAGIATQPSPTSHASLELDCKCWLKEQHQKPGNVFLHPIHRLDKPVSGIVLFAKTSKALSRLNASMRAHEMQKVYTAHVEGLITPLEGVLEHYLTHGDHYAHVSSPKSKDAKRACLSYIVKEQQDSISIVEISLQTGRYHQIRAQMAAIGHPVIGDVKYGSTRPMPEGTIALSHTKFSFPHPTTREKMTFLLEKKCL